VEARLGNDDSEMVLAAAEGSSKKEAQQRAAELALANWDSDGDEAKTRGMQ
jgi:ribonuclease-3